MHFRRWLDIKGCLKQNEYLTEKKRGKERYDPMQKYRLVWDVMTHNMNQLIERGGLNLTMDKTTWPNSSCANVHGRLNGEKTDKGRAACVVARLTEAVSVCMDTSSQVLSNLSTIHSNGSSGGCLIDGYYYTSCKRCIEGNE